MATPIRVASIPARHPYVEHLAGPGVDRLADPSPPGAPPGRWWPPVMLDAAWISANAGAFDLLHLHFGAESFSPRELRGALAALRAADRPLVFTVHDLENPQLADQGRHRAQLDVLVPAADALLTLTPGAAAEIERRWGRRATVVEHPHVLPLDVDTPAGRARPERLVGLHLRDLRPNVDGLGATTALLAAVRELPDVRVRVELNDRVRDPEQRDAIRRLCADDPQIRLRERPRASDAELAASLADLDVSVLPYAHGTHSGWLELCWDLGVAVAAPRVGHVAEQHPDPATLAAFDPGGLAPALAHLLGRAPRPGAPERRELQARRRAERRLAQPRIAAAHLDCYRSVL